MFSAHALHVRLIAVTRQFIVFGTYTCFLNSSQSFNDLKQFSKYKKLKKESYIYINLSSFHVFKHTL